VSTPSPSASPARRPRRDGPATPLSRARIVSTALALVDRCGAGALSMRRLGAELGVDPMAMYYHIPGKEALLDAIVEAVMGEIDLGLDRPGDEPVERILVAARAYRDALLAHGNALPIVLSRGPATPVAMRPVELLLGVFRDAGLPPGLALVAMNTVAAAVRGAVALGATDRCEPSAEHREVLEAVLSAGPFPNLREALLAAPDPDRSTERDFEFGLRALARGLLAEGQGRRFTRG